jgi:hypothetical protein
LDRLGQPDEAARIRVRARLATELYWGSELPRARALAAEAIAAARADGDRRALTAALAVGQFVLRGPDWLHERIRLGNELACLAVDAGDDAELNARRRWCPIRFKPTPSEPMRSSPC